MAVRIPMPTDMYAKGVVLKRVWIILESFHISLRFIARSDLYAASGK